MRKFKFRAWDNEVNIMLKWETLLNAYNLIDLFEPKNSRFVLQQFTGLKDKNGKEIYEGDILKGYEHLSEIKWDDEGAGFTCGDSWLCALNIKYTEVIGNIYENPELLKEEK